MPAYNNDTALRYKPLEHGLRQLFVALSIIDLVLIRIPNGAISRFVMFGMAHLSLFGVIMLSLLSPADLKQPAPLLTLLGDVFLTSTILAMAIVKCIHQKSGTVLLLIINAYLWANPQNVHGTR